jgi:hypothetical protein
VRDQVSHPYKTTSSHFYTADGKTKDSELYGSKHCD